MADSLSVLSSTVRSSISLVESERPRPNRKPNCFFHNFRVLTATAFYSENYAQQMVPSSATTTTARVDQKSNYSFHKFRTLTATAFYSENYAQQTIPLSAITMTAFLNIDCKQQPRLMGMENMGNFL